MKHKYIILFIVVISGIFFNSCNNNNPVSTSSNASPPSSNFDAIYAVKWMDLLYNAVSYQNINPPQASRIYCYAAITLYESVRCGNLLNYSLSGQLNGMPNMPTISETALYDWPSVLVGSMPTIIHGICDTIVYITDNNINTLKTQQDQERRGAVSGDVVDRSEAFGVSLANKILEWAHTDNYTQTRTMVYVVPPRSINPAYWEPTDPVHLKPTEPFWNLIRPFAMTNARACDVPMTTQFDTLPGSGFYNLAMEVKTTVDNLSLEQQTIALYWQDKLRTGTPPGHWVSIMNEITGVLHLKLDRAAEMYALTCIAMADAFISCWDTKYEVNLLRPYTFIRQYIHATTWNAYLPIPPFPSYNSGHSCESGAAAEILTSMFGTVAFTDTTLTQFNFNPRSFSSFYQARDEAMNSRLYGGIHYRQDNELGKQQGILVAHTVLNRVKLRPF